MKTSAIIDVVSFVTKKWDKQRKSERRQTSRTVRRMEAWRRSQRVSIREAAFEVMEAAYMKASTGGTLPAQARQVMYAARGEIQRQTGQMLDDDYFTQRLLPDYIEDHPNQTRTWNVVFDARGHLWEPHTEREVPLGTIDVRQYIEDIASIAAPTILPPLDADSECYFPTTGPKHRFSALLFIEKEGFGALFRQVRIAERYDIAVMSTKGMSVTACRLLVDRICGEQQIPLLVLHDFDKAGFSILSTLHQDTRRYEFANHIRVIDLGVRLTDVQENELESEDVTYGNKDPRDNLRKNGATDDEVGFLCAGSQGAHFRGRRVELNAFTSGQFIAWIERKLKQHGIAKVIPDEGVINLAYRRAVAAHFMRDQLQGQIREAAVQRATAATTPTDFRQQIVELLAMDPQMPWDSAVSKIAAAAFVKNATPRKTGSAS